MRLRRPARVRPTVATLATLGLLLPFGHVSAAAVPQDTPAAAYLDVRDDDGRLAVAAGEPVDGQLVAAAATSQRLVVTTRDGDHRTHDLGPTDDVIAVVHDLLSSPDVAEVEADQVVTTAGDPLADGQWELDRVGARVTHSDGADGAGVVVAVLDTGVMPDHPDLHANVVAGFDAITRTAADTIPDVHGHGTLAAGTVAATANSVGGRGVAHAASIMPVKVLSDNGSGSMSDVAAGVNWAIDNGADVINLSLAGTASTSQMNAALVRAVDAGVVVVAASGNDGDGDNLPSWPGAHEDAIAVGATRADDRIARFSGHGDHLAVSAPGVRVLGTSNDPDQPWVTWSGTSAATPVTAGALAAAIQAGGLTLTDRDSVGTLVDALLATVDDVGPAGWDPHFGHGIVRVDRLVAEVAASEEPSTPVTDDLDEGTNDDEPKDDGSQDDEPKDDEPKDDEPKADEPKADDPKADEPKTDEPKADDPKTDEPKDDTSKDDGTKDEPASFSDVPADSTHRVNIDLIRAAGITDGCGGDRYCPSDAVTRGQMATFLARALKLELRTYEGRFSDVPAGHTHARAIEALARAGITGGCGGDRYCPSDAVRRDQMASFLTRAYDLPVPRLLDVFVDVTGGVHAPNIAAVRAAEITTGCGGGRYCPGDAVRRDQMASFLARAMHR